MAVTLAMQANDISTLSSAVYSINNSDTGTPPVTKWAGYKILDGSAGELTNTQRMPNTGAAEKFDVAPVLRNLVSTPFPGLMVQNVTTVTEYAAAYSISYGEIQFDADACETTVTLGSSTTGKEVVNAYLEAWEDANLFNSGELVILSDRPNKCYVGRQQSDYLYFYKKTGTVYVLLSIVYSDGTTDASSTSITLNGDAGYISCGPANLFSTPTKEMSGYTLKIYDAPPVDGNEIKIYDFVLESICEDEAFTMTFYWLNQKGGWETLEMEQINGGAGRNAVLYEQPVFSSSSNRHQTGGLSHADLRAQSSFTLSRKFESSPEAHKFFKSIYSGREFYVKYNDGMQYIAHKCEIQNGSYAGVGNKEVEIQIPIVLNNPL